MRYDVDLEARTMTTRLAMERSTSKRGPQSPPPSRVEDGDACSHGPASLNSQSWLIGNSDSTSMSTSAFGIDPELLASLRTLIVRDSCSWVCWLPISVVLQRHHFRQNK